MSNVSVKRRILQGLVIAMAAWPLAQFILTKTHDLNPWKLFGFGMYSVPGPRLELRVVGLGADGRARLIPRSEYRESELREAARYFNYRAELGDFASADALAATVLAERPELESVVVGVQQFRISPETARVVSDAQYRRFTRDGGSEPFEPPEPKLAPSR